MSALPSVTVPWRRPGRTKEVLSLSANVRRGAIWSFTSTIILRFAGIGITAIVARILTPHDFGVFAVATTVFTIVSALGEFGVTSCLARADLDVTALAPTLWTVSLASSLAMASVLFVFAAPISAALGSQDATHPVQVMAIVMVIWGASAVPTAQCVRDFKQDKILLANALSFLPSTVLLIILAKHGNGAMAFAWSRVLGQAISCAVVLLSVPKLHRPGMTRGALSVLYKVGLPLAGANFIGYILQNVDYAFIGRLIGPIMLGTYVLAFNVASWSSTLLMGVLNNVSMPAFSRVKHDPARLRAAMADGTRVVMLVAAPMCTMVMFLSRPIVLTLYGHRWESSGPVLTILSCYGLISVLGILFSNMLAALGRSKFVLAVQLIWLACLVPAMAIGVSVDGILGAAIAHVVIIAPVVLPSYLLALKRATGVRISLLAKSAFPPLAAATAAGCLAWVAASLFHSPLVQLAAGLAAGTSLYALLTAPQLILLLTRGRAVPARLKRILSTYHWAADLLGISMGLPTRQAPLRASHEAPGPLRSRRGNHVTGYGAAGSAKMTMTRPDYLIPRVRVSDRPSHVVRILQVYSILLMVFPADYAVRAIGADGYAAGLVSYAMLALWLAGTLLGRHNPFTCRYPVRVTLVGIWVVTIASYVLMDPASLSATQMTAADRWLMQLAGVSGVVLVAAEGLHTIEDVKHVLRSLIWGGALCGIVAAIQFTARINLAQYLKLPGFSQNNVDSTTAVIIERGSLNRVFGTAIDPIELGVCAGMLLALAAFLLMHDYNRPRWTRVAPLLCIAVAIPISVSRSAILAMTASLGVLVVTLPPLRRLKWLSVFPVTLILVLAAAPGLIGTLVYYFAAGESGSDPSVEHRTNNYPYVEQLVRRAPWLGKGGGTYIPVELHVLDNQYLTTAIELGLLGVVAVAFFLAWPVVAALVARRRTSNSELRDLCAALAGAELAAVICATTFDGFSFPMFYNLQALIAGLIGATWIMANRKDLPINAYQNGASKVMGPD